MLIFRLYLSLFGGKISQVSKIKVVDACIIRIQCYHDTVTFSCYTLNLKKYLPRQMKKNVTILDVFVCSCSLSLLVDLLRSFQDSWQIVFVQNVILSSTVCWENSTHILSVFWGFIIMITIILWGPQCHRVTKKQSVSVVSCGI